MSRFAAVIFLICSASAEPVRDVSPEEFARLAMQTSESKPKTNLLQTSANPAVLAKNKKAWTEAEKAEKKKEWLARKETRLADQNLHRHVTEEEQIVEDEKKEQEAKEAALASNSEEEAVGKKANLKVEVEETSSAELAKANKTYACREKGSQVLAMYLSGLQIAPTRHNQAKEKCMKSQLAQHCMPYERFDVTYIEPCDADDAACMQRRVINDHPGCLNRNVDWESVKNYALSADRHMMEVLSMWCSHIKVLKEVQRRVVADEQFAKDYPAILMLEDHVLLDKEWTEEVTKDWVTNYHKTGNQWDMVLLDTHGGKAHTDKVGEFRGKSIYKPSWKANYGGFHAVLVRTPVISTLLEKMQTLNVVPIEWLAKSINDDPKGLQILSWEAGVSTVEWQSSATTKDYFLPKDCMKIPEEEKLKTRKQH